MNKIKELIDIDFEKCTPDDVRNIIKDVKILYVPFYLKKGVYVLRGRKGAGFTKRSQMTYCPAEKCTTLNRASLVGQTMFYGVISDNQEHQENARAIITSECSKLFRGEIENAGRETITVSHWKIIKPLHVVSLIDDTTFPEIRDNALLNQLRSVFSSFHGQMRSTEEEVEMVRFISAEFSKKVNNDKEYLISATIASDIVKEMEFDGIVYPSVQLGGQAGLNIAIVPKAVNKKMRFLRTLEQTFYKNGKQAFIRLEKVDGKKLSNLKVTDSEIAKELGISSISTLPIV